jgi:hypothetical protein
MSMETWEAEFYPIDARDCGAKDAVAHSLRKWRGLRADALQRHGMTVVATPMSCPRITDGRNELSIDADSCALCVEYFHDGEAYDDFGACGSCPLYLVAGHPCTDTPHEGPSAYGAFAGSRRDPEPMIALLERAEAYEREQAKLSANEVLVGRIAAIEKERDEARAEALAWKSESVSRDHLRRRIDELTAENLDLCHEWAQWREKWTHTLDTYGRLLLQARHDTTIIQPDQKAE